MLPGPIRNGSPHAPLNVGMSVVNATIVVGSPSNLFRRIAGVCSTSRASARPATPPPPRRGSTAFPQRRRTTPRPKHDFGFSGVPHPVGSAPAADRPDVQRASPQQRILRERDPPNVLQNIEQGMNRRMAKFG